MGKNNKYLMAVREKWDGLSAKRKHRVTMTAVIAFTFIILFIVYPVVFGHSYKGTEYRWSMNSNSMKHDIYISKNEKHGLEVFSTTKGKYSRYYERSYNSFDVKKADGSYYCTYSPKILTKRYKNAFDYGIDKPSSYAYWTPKKVSQRHLVLKVSKSKLKQKATSIFDFEYSRQNNTLVPFSDVKRLHLDPMLHLTGTYKPENAS